MNHQPNKSYVGNLLFTVIILTALLGLPGCGGSNEQTIVAQTGSVQTQAGSAVADSLATEALLDSTHHTASPAAPAKEQLPADKTKDVGLVTKNPVTPPVAVKTTTPVVKPAATTTTDKSPAPVATPTPVVKPADPVKEVIPVPQPTPVKTAPAPVVKETPDPGSWMVPAKYKSMTSPYPVNAESIALGKSVYGTHCKSCHGSKGLGDGPKSTTIDTKMRTFRDPNFRAQNEGEVYYKSIFGRGDMPKYDKKISDKEEQWAVVHYIMSLK